MKIYTGYFAMAHRYKEANLGVVSIALYFPKYGVKNHDRYEVPECKFLAPTSTLLNKYKQGLIDEQEYEKEYFDSLSVNIVKMQLNKLIEMFSNKPGIVLCCYEKPTDFCHRHLLAKYCKEHFDIDIEEYKIQ